MNTRSSNSKEKMLSFLTIVFAVIFSFCLTAPMILETIENVRYAKSTGELRPEISNQNDEIDNNQGNCTEPLPFNPRIPVNPRIPEHNDESGIIPYVGSYQWYSNLFGW